MTIELRARLVLVLAAVSGITDASGFLHLGGAFSSVMTGNLVLVGLGTGTGDAALAGTSGVAVIAFIAGCIVGGRLAGHHSSKDTVWPQAITRTLTTEFVVFVAYATALEVVGGNPHGDVVKAALLASNAVALGLQSSAILRFGDSGLSTTYMTGTLTRTVIHLASGRPIREIALNLKILSTMILGGIAGGYVAAHAMRYIPAFQLAGIGLVALTAMAADRQRTQSLGWR
jgi:uncharacterized membrane protein YoaK (UPF0700 family)